jgi:dihydrofolate reductase
VSLAEEVTMSRIVLVTSMSVDGYMEGPGRDISWHRVDEEVHEHFNEVLGTMGAFLEGRVTYELMESFWPTADSDPDSAPAEVEFARIWRRTPKIVYSRTLERAGSNATIVRQVDPDEVRALKSRFRGDLVVGGAHLAAEFHRLDLVDEFRIYVHPVLVGNGTPSFARGEAMRPLRLIETRTFGNGVVLLRHERDRGDPGGGTPG